MFQFKTTKKKQQKKGHSSANPVFISPPQKQENPKHKKNNDLF